MASDNRLDFISKISEPAVERMKLIRSQYISLDNELKDIHDLLHQRDIYEGKRTIALARTNLEVSLQFAIKSLCLLGEIND